MSKLTIQLIILTTLVVGWTIFMLYQQVQHKKRMKEIDDRRKVERMRGSEEWIRRLGEEVRDLRRSAMVPDEGYMPSAMFKTDKLSPNKKIKSHKLVERKYTMRSPGVYTREVDLSVWVPVNNENDLDEL